MAGSISKVGSKFRVTLELGTDSHGKRLRKYITAMTESEAKKLLNEFEYNQRRNLTLQDTEMTFGEFLNHRMDNYVKYNCEVTTQYGYRNIISKHIIPYMGNVQLQKLLPQHLQSYYKHLLEDKKLSPNSVHKHHANIRKALDYALKQQFVYRNIADAVSLPKKVKFEANYYTIEQLRKLFDCVNDTRLEVPVFLAGYLGLRREEIVGLRWKYVDLDKRLLQIKEVRTSAGANVVTKKPKSEKSERTLFIPDELLAVLQKCRDRQDELKVILEGNYDSSDYVFAHDNGKPYRVNSVTEMFGAFLVKYQLPKLRLHDLRHTFSSILYEYGVDLKAISEALGHSDIGTTNKIYTHLFDKTHKDTVNAMSEALNRN
ncbi:site-specific integrase [Paenibacillus sp. FSL K6-2859]|jgi:integrase|uniref:site-specific integrase n=1 Tax=Paenibacillus sp. FSL K6-2859 TaxID=2921482 RepID=UPI0030F6F128